MMKTVVVTGGIGSGKSEVCQMLHEMYGCGIYKADDKVKALYHEHPSLLSDIESALGERYRDDSGAFVPKLLADRIFGDCDALKTVESFVFPALIEDYRKWSESRADDRFAVFESATILEKPQLKGFGDVVLLVDAPFDLRLERAASRDEVPLETVLSRMQNQQLMNSISRGEADAPADAVILNVGTKEELRAQAAEMIENILKLK